MWKYEKNLKFWEKTQKFGENVETEIFLEIRVKFGNEGKNWKTFGNKSEICKTI